MKWTKYVLGACFAGAITASYSMQELIQRLTGEPSEQEVSLYEQIKQDVERADADAIAYLCRALAFDYVNFGYDLDEGLAILKDLLKVKLDSKKAELEDRLEQAVVPAVAAPAVARAAASLSIGLFAERIGQERSTHERQVVRLYKRIHVNIFPIFMIYTSPVFLFTHVE